MHNVGRNVVVIPWSLDPEVRKRPRGAIQYEYELGWFELELKAKRRSPVPLESESYSVVLGSSKSNPESSLRLQPGQWVTAKIRFAIEEIRNSSIASPIKPGVAEIGAHWRQGLYTWDQDGCTLKTGYYKYAYEEATHPASIEIRK